MGETPLPFTYILNSPTLNTIIYSIKHFYMKRIIFTSSYSGNVAGKRMKVRNDAKTKTNMLVLAKGKQEYAYGKPSEVVNQSHLFGNFGELQKADGTWIYTQKLKTMRDSAKMNMHMELPNDTIMTSVNNLLRNVLLFKGIGFADVERNLKLFDYDVRPYRIAELQSTIGKLNDEATKLNIDYELPAYRLVRNNITNRLAEITKQILDLKSKIGYWKAVKPFVTYNVLTNINYDSRGKKQRLNPDEQYHLSSITVKRATKNIVNYMGQQQTECSLLFDNKTFSHLKLWVESFNIIS